MNSRCPIMFEMSETCYLSWMDNSYITLHKSKQKGYGTLSIPKCPNEIHVFDIFDNCPHPCTTAVTYPVETSPYNFYRNWKCPTFMPVSYITSQ